MNDLLSADSVTSLAFVVAGAVIAVRSRPPRSGRLTFAALVAATGVGSVIQHGPAPPWADLAHDLPLVALIAYLAVDAGADLTERPPATGWWLAPSLALVPAIVALPRTGDAAQGVLAAVTIGLWIERARTRPTTRRAVILAVSLLAVGALAGTLTRIGLPSTERIVLLPGHAVWHLLAATALLRLSPIVGRPWRPPARPDLTSGDERPVVHTGSR